MNEHDERLDRAIHGALGDLVAAAPRRGEVPLHHARPAAAGTRRPLVAAGVALTAAAGLIGVFAVTRSPDIDTGSATEPPVATAAPASTAPSTSSTTVAVAAPRAYDAATLDSGYAAYVASGTTCGASAQIPAAATSVQTIHGDVDGDTVDDPVSLYLWNGDWHVHVVSSARNQPSDTIVRVLVQQTMEVSFEDLDHSLGAATPPPQVIMALGRGPNDDGIGVNYTFLSLTPDDCVRQWQYRDGVFQWATVDWATVDEAGHITGMICETAAGSRSTTLVDAIQNDDGTWALRSQRLTHNFTTAALEQLPDETVADSPEFVTTHKDLTGCTHPPVS